MKTETLSTKDIIRDIASMKHIAINLLDIGREYNKVLKYIFDNDFFNREGNPIPPKNEILEAVGLKSSEFKRQLDLIYQELLAQEDPSLYFNFQDVEFRFALRYLDRSHEFTVKTLPVVPRVGEQIRLTFFRAHIECPLFFVRSIDHHFVGNRQIVTFELKPWRYNRFWEWTLDEAVVRKYISDSEYRHPDDDHLKRKLHIRPRWAE